MSLGSRGFRRYPSEENCPIDRIVSTVELCKDASVVLGLEYQAAVDPGQSIYPAGCYWENTESYFNAIVDPSQTNPGSFRGRGGVCINGKF